MQIQSLGWEDPPEKEWHPTPVFLPVRPHGQRSLVSYSPWGCKRVRHELMAKQEEEKSRASRIRKSV